MHELSLAVALVEQVGEICRKERAERALRIEVVVGALSGVERDPLEFCFPLAAENTVAAGATLVVEEVPVTLACRACGERTRPEVPFIRCMACGSTNVEVVEGRDFLIKTVEVI
ncbi:MAG: hydrogenase maturation nickel metallochaperone HypA [Deltaproteobacteria bacterium]|nr:hydrogenase maturation nickel metallochaperone HypA [Deltaproteobacteria bacterium]